MKKSVIVVLSIILVIGCFVAAYFLLFDKKDGTNQNNEGSNAVSFEVAKKDYLFKTVYTLEKEYEFDTDLLSSYSCEVSGSLAAITEKYALYDCFLKDEEEGNIYIYDYESNKIVKTYKNMYIINTSVDYFDNEYVLFSNYECDLDDCVYILYDLTENKEIYVSKGTEIGEIYGDWGFEFLSSKYFKVGNGIVNFDGKEVIKANEYSMVYLINNDNYFVGLKNDKVVVVDYNNNVKLDNLVIARTTKNYIVTFEENNVNVYNNDLDLLAKGNLTIKKLSNDEIFMDYFEQLTDEEIDEYDGEYIYLNVEEYNNSLFISYCEEKKCTLNVYRDGELSTYENTKLLEYRSYEDTYYNNLIFYDTVVNNNGKKMFKFYSLDFKTELEFEYSDEIEYYFYKYDKENILVEKYNYMENVEKVYYLYNGNSKKMTEYNGDDIKLIVEEELDYIYVDKNGKELKFDENNGFIADYGLNKEFIVLENGKMMLFNYEYK